MSQINLHNVLRFILKTCIFFVEQQNAEVVITPNGEHHRQRCLVQDRTRRTCPLSQLRHPHALLSFDCYGDMT